MTPRAWRMRRSIWTRFDATWVGPSLVDVPLRCTCSNPIFNLPRDGAATNAGPTRHRRSSIDGHALHLHTRTNPGARIFRRGRDGARSRWRVVPAGVAARFFKGSETLRGAFL